MEYLASLNNVQDYWIRALSEFLGTALLVLLGNGVCASVSYKRMGGNQSGRFVLVAFGWGFAVFFGALVSVSLNGSGHLNPAITLMDVIIQSKKIITNSVYDVATMAFNINYQSALALTFFVFAFFQIAGAMFGQTVLNFINFKFITDKENDIFVIRGAHCTVPSYKNKEDKATIFNFSYELVGTLVLCGVILAFSSSNFNNISLGKLDGIVVTFLVCAIGISLGSATGYAINPARDLGPRLIYMATIKLFRKEEIELKYANWSYGWVPIAAPLVAGAIIGCFGLI